MKEYLLFFKRRMVMTITRLTAAVGLLALFVACGPSANKPGNDFTRTVYAPQYAQGFEILGAEDRKSTLLRVKNPWQGASDVVMDLLILRDNEHIPAGFQGQVIKGEAQRIICMSSSYVAMLDAVDATDRIVGVSGLHFIYNDKILARQDAIGDVGYEGNINYELLVALDPDLVLLYGVNGTSTLQHKLETLGIPYAYIGEYVEDAPLSKTEWMIALAEIVGRREKAENVFEQISTRYQTLKDQVATISTDPNTRPKVMVNTPYADTWFMPSQNSYIAQLIHDAGGAYLYQANTTNQSLPIDMEEATLLLAQADVWIHVEQVNSLKELRLRYPKFKDSPCVYRGAVYNCDKRRIPGKGNDFWESGILHPDQILQDLIKIFHPDLMPEHEFYYYRSLQ